MVIRYLIGLMFGAVLSLNIISLSRASVKEEWGNIALSVGAICVLCAVMADAQSELTTKHISDVVEDIERERGNYEP